MASTGDRRVLRKQPRSLAFGAGGALQSLVAASVGPPALAKLPGREQEVAMIVYLIGEATARDVEHALSAKLTNSAIRSMLRRLTAKGVLRQRRDGREFVYLPGICDVTAREQALLRLAEDYFDGSLFRAALILLEMLNKTQPESFPALIQQIGYPALVQPIANGRRAPTAQPSWNRR